jgi:hypothetical protein
MAATLALGDNAGMGDDLVRVSRVLSIAVIGAWAVAVVTYVADAIVRYRGTGPGTGRLRLEGALTFSAPLLTALLVLGLALALLDPDRRLVQAYVAGAGLAVVAGAAFLLLFLTGGDRAKLEAARVGTFVETLLLAGAVFYVGQQWLANRSGIGLPPAEGGESESGYESSEPDLNR